ncbi:MAG TPA: DUF3068 domain-containing protein [Dehalococcoidia bacterium]|nr:DUF3068 domain-containing protein [Dehalococcoidia bacterium]
MGMRWKGWSGALAIIGLVLIIFAFVWSLVIFPAMAKLPADLNETTNFTGTYYEMNPQTQQMEQIPVNVERHYEATEIQDGILILHQTVTTTQADDGTALPKYGLEEILGVDRSTREYVSGYGDMDRSGQFSFPSDLEQKSYQLWNPTARRDLEAKFVAEEEAGDLTVYAFQVAEEGIELGNYPGTDFPQTLDVTINMKAEPLSGTTVFSQSITTISVTYAPEMSIPVYISSIQFTDATISEMLDTASNARTLLLWATVYGFWIAIGLGLALILAGVLVANRSR